MARRRAGRVALLVGFACMAAAGAGQADPWRLTASAGASATYNHNFGSNGLGDYFTACLNASLGIQSGQSGRLKLNGTVGASQFLCTGGQGNTFTPNINLTATLEAIEKFFFIDATANASTSFITPFGPQPANQTVQTNNRYVTQSYSVSPYIQGVFAPNITYSVRDDNVWTTSATYGNSSAKTPTTYYNNLNGQASSVIGYGGGLTLQYTRQEYDNGVATGTYVTQIGRVIASYAVDPQLQLSLRGGYQSDKFPALTGADGALLPSQSNQGPIYGGGINWRPSDRTSISGYWEHQFFGSSYNFQANHRLPNVALSATFTRGLSSYPQLGLVIPAGVTVAQFLDAAFATRIPDPVQRAAAVELFLAKTGLPPTLASPLNFYAQTITLQQGATLSAVWVGVRNAVGFTLFNLETSAISASGDVLPPAFAGGANNTQTGGGVNYSYRLSELTNFVASANYFVTKPNNTQNLPGNNLRSNNFNISTSVGTQFSPKTSGSVGLTYFNFDTPGANSIPSQSTLSVYANINHNF